MTKISRRRFAQMMAGGLALTAIGGCQPGRRGSEEDLPVLANPTSELLGAPPKPSNSRRILRNDNVPGFYVRYYEPFEAIDPTEWTLVVDGLVSNVLGLSLADVLLLPRVAQTSRMKCVECWSAAARWEGFHIRDLLELAEPLPNATWVHFFCEDDYFESMRLEALLSDRVVFVHHMDGSILPDIYGAPLRLMVPFRYGYKSAKAIRHIEFAGSEMPGYWSVFGAYGAAGDIARGTDHPLDLEGTRSIHGGGEIFYPDGIESTG